MSENEPIISAQLLEEVRRFVEERFQPEIGSIGAGVPEEFRLMGAGRKKRPFT